MTRLHELHQNEDVGSVGLGAVATILQDNPDELEARDGINNTPLHVAASMGQIELAEVLLEHGADVNSRGDSGQTPLHYAAKEQNTEVVRTLIRHGANLERLCAREGTFAAGCSHDTGTCGIEGDRQGLHHEAPCSSLPRLPGNPVEAVREREPAAGQAAPLCVSGAFDGHPLDANRQGRCECGLPQRDSEVALPR